MDYKELSKWVWDIAKYVMTGVIITSFLGKFGQDTGLLYLVSIAIVALLFVLGVHFQKLSKKK